MESVCFTGACPNMSRDELAEKAGKKYEVKSSVTKTLDILVCADPNAKSAKLEKAKQNGTRIISYDEFIKTLDLDDEEFNFGKKISQKILEKVRKITTTDVSTFFYYGSSEPLKITTSKLGGYPYWTRGKDFPKTKDGKSNLVMLAQINFGEIPHLKDFPERGILQLFLEPQSLYGLLSGNYCAVYHEEIGEPMSVAELDEMGVKTQAYCERRDFPLRQEAGLYFSIPESQSMPPCCLGRFENALFKAISDLKIRVPSDFCEENCDSDILDEDALEEYRYSCEFFDSKIGGYPAFCQGDPRSACDDLDVLLFQIEGENNIIDWGDGGLANFFISREDLKKRDFSRVLFNYDCY